MKTILAITWMNLRNVGSRLGTSLVIVVGIAGVVGVLVSMLSMSRGFERTLAGTGSESRALLLSAGVISELSSGISRDAVPLIASLPGISRGADGQPLVSAETMVITELKRPDPPYGALNVALRGVEPAGLAMRREVKLAEGRWFQTGLNEVVAGRGAQRQFGGVAVGTVLHFRGSQWTVVGIFESGGDAHESELWTDANTARNAFGRPGASSLLVQLESPAALAPLQAALKADPRFQLEAQSERHYYESQSQSFTDRLGVLTGILVTLMAIGALFGALNTMYSAVSARSREIATLRAIGFSGAPVVASVLVEAVVLAVAGGSLGAAVSYALFNGMTVSTIGGNFTQVAFSFAVTPDLLQKGLLWSIGIGLIGGLAPALRAARLPVVDALRAA
ncbi:MAG TPA: ABC transporter permease [Candidatus Binatia bacterium]|nr:ABC transporter permease [Candidatus Binatia bacterium]